MVLTEAQRTVVENNMGLVGTVMKEKLNGGSALSYYSYDDLFQIGCIGLCKAAATDSRSLHQSKTYTHLVRSMFI